MPGLRGLSVSEFRATPTTSPDNERGAAVEFTGDDERDVFLRALGRLACGRLSEPVACAHTVRRRS